MDIHTLVSRQRDFFRTGATLDLDFRLRALERLARALEERYGQDAAPLYPRLTTYLAALCRARLVLITPPPKGE